MNFKDYLKTQTLPSFFVVVTCITFAMAVIGTIFEPDVQLSYGVLFSPFVFGLAASLIQLLGYSSKELSARQVLVHKVLHLFLMEAVIMTILYGVGALTGAGVTCALALSILIIYVAATWLVWINDKRTSDVVNKALKQLQGHSRDVE